MKTPLFSIITITFNAESTLEPTLCSVAAQQENDYEYLIVDGASKDGTVALARQYDCVTRIISEPDRGLYDAMNKGIKAATGEYLVFLNAGDSLYAPDTLKKLHDFIGENRPDILYGETAIVDSDRRFIAMRKVSEWVCSSVIRHSLSAGNWHRSMISHTVSRPILTGVFVA